MAENPYGLSSQDIQDLQQIKAALPTGDSRHAKLDTLLSSAPKYTPESIKAMAMNAQTAKNMQPVNASYGVDPNAPKAVMPQVDQSPMDYAKALGGGAVGYAKGAGRTAFAATINPANPFTGGLTVNAETPDALKAKTLAEQVGGYAETGTELLAGSAGVAKSLPSTARAAGNFQKALAAAGKEAVEVNIPGSVAIKAQQLAESGGSMPKVLRDFLKRTTDPTKPPLTYEEARNFYQNATRLSADEAKRLTPVMKRQVGEFTRELGKSIGDVAEGAGVGEEYAQAMSEFHKAMKLKGLSDKAIDILAKEIVPRLVGYGAAGYGATLGVRAALK